MIEGALRRIGRLEQGSDSEIVVTLPEQHGHALLKEPLLGVDPHAVLDRSV
jgi:ABC-type lipopolysaccharide export system ATPase subunit